MTSKKRILFVYPEMMLGGSTTSLLTLLNTIDYRVYEVDLLLYKNRGEYLKDIPDQVNLLEEASIYEEGRLINSGIRKLLLSCIDFRLINGIWLSIKNNKKFSFSNLRVALMQEAAYEQVKLSRQINDNYYAAVGFLECWPNAYVWKKVNAKTKIAWMHMDYKNSRFLPEIDVEMLENMDKIVCVSYGCCENFIKEFETLENKVVCFENIVSENMISQKSKEIVEKIDDKKGISFVTTCRLDIYTKGLDRAVRAVKRLVEEGYLFRWYLIGDGNDKVKLSNMIKENNLECFIKLLGPKYNPFPYLTQCDVFLLPSRYEGKPMAVTEAQILKLPVIATNYKSASEQICHEKDGLIVGNNDDEIYLGMKLVLDKPELISKFRENLMLRKFTNESAILKFYEIIDGV